MDFPGDYQSHRRHHHRRDDDDEDDDAADRFARPPGRHTGEDDFPPPPFRPPPFSGDDDFRPPPFGRPPSGDDDYPPPPFGRRPDFPVEDAPPAYHNPPQASYLSSVHHVSQDPPPETESHHHHHHIHRPHLPSFHHEDKLPEPSSELSSKPAVRVFCKAETNYSLTIREGSVVLAPSDPSDPYQQWIKDEKFSTKVKDEERFPSFSLVNKATGEALKHSIGATQPVQLAPYNPNALDESVLWTLSRDLGDGYRTIRMVSNIRLNVDAFNGDKNHGGVHDGTTIVLWEWKKGDNQRWKIIPLNEE